MVRPRDTHTVVPVAVPLTPPASPYCISPKPVASAHVITTTSRPTAFLRKSSVSSRLRRESDAALTSAAVVAMLFSPYFAAARTRLFPQLSGRSRSLRTRSASFFAATPSSIA